MFQTCLAFKSLLMTPGWNTWKKRGGGGKTGHMINNGEFLIPEPPGAKAEERLFYLVNRKRSHSLICRGCGVSLLKRKNQQLASAINQLQPRQFARTPWYMFLTLNGWISLATVNKRWAGSSTGRLFSFRTTQEWVEKERKKTAGQLTRIIMLSHTNKA